LKRDKRYQVRLDYIFENGALVVLSSEDKKNLEQVHLRNLVVIVSVVEVEAYLVQHLFVFEYQHYLFAVFLEAHCASARKV